MAEELPVVRSLAASSPKADAARVFQSLVADPGVEKVWLDGVRRPALDRSTAQIGAPAAWQAGLSDTGVKVAVLDTGVDGAHPDLAGRVGARANFTGEPDNTDTVGHGTHVAATIAGADDEYRGVAPDAQILDGKVCDTRTCPESSILAGMQWAVEQGADVVNLSLGGPDEPGIDPLEEAVNALSASSGALFVVAAGNGYASVDSPGTADAALTVGAVHRDDSPADFSNRGPRPEDGAVKPDLTAPGVDIAAAKSSAGRLGTPVDADHVAMSGTSMATPHVAGAAALLKQRHPDWSGQRIKSALMASGELNPALTPYEQGTGRVDVAAAIAQRVTSEPSSLALGAQEWPHDDVPVAREVTYRNSGSDPVTLDLSVETTAPEGMFTVSPARLTTPAGGTGTATVTGDLRIGAVDGSFSAWVVAGGGLRVPVGLHRDVETHDVTFQTIGLDGAPHPSSSTSIMGLSVPGFHDIHLPGSTTVRLRPGHYAVGTVFTRPDFSYEGTVIRPELEITGPTTVTTDLRAAPPVHVEVPDPSAALKARLVTTHRSYDGVLRYAHGVLARGEEFRYAHVGQAAPPGEVTTSFQHEYAADPVDDAEVRYRLAWTEDGVLGGVDRAYTAQDLAEVRTDLGLVPDGVAVAHGGAPAFSGVATLSSIVFPHRVRPSGRVIDRVSTETPWSWEHSRQDRQDNSDPRDYRPGQVYRERMGTPVFGPSGNATATRTGDSIDVTASLFDDSSGNHGRSHHSSASTVLRRDGVLVGETTEPGSGEFAVAPGAAEYRLEASYESDQEFSSALSAAWTFRSDTTTAPAELPLGVVRFAPELDRSGNAPAGAFAVPLNATTPFTSTTVDASFDDGETWTTVPVAGGVATVPNLTSGWVSLRATARGEHGTFEQTTVHAYRIG